MESIYPQQHRYEEHTAMRHRRKTQKNDSIFIEIEIHRQFRFTSEGNEITILKIHVHTCVQSRLFTMAQTGKPADCPAPAAWMKKVWYVCMYVCVHVHTHTHSKYIYTMHYYSTIKKGRKSCHLQQHGWSLKALCSVKEVRQRERNIVWSPLNVES